MSVKNGIYALKAELWQLFCLYVSVIKAGCQGQLAMDIGQAIFEIRKERELKQETVALAANTDSGYLSRIETGSRKPSLPMLEKIAAAMGVSVTLIMAKVEGISFANREAPELIESSLPDEAIQLRQNFRTLSADNQRALLEIAKVLNRLQRNS